MFGGGIYDSWINEFIDNGNIRENCKFFNMNEIEKQNQFSPSFNLDMFH